MITSTERQVDNWLYITQTKHVGGVRYRREIRNNGNTVETGAWRRVWGF